MMPRPLRGVPALMLEIGGPPVVPDAMPMRVRCVQESHQRGRDGG